MNKPNFFIVGAPKCGTTSLFFWLNQHPQVFMPDRKEVHFFNVDGMTRIDTLADYEALFADASEQHSAVGEGSTHYLYSRRAIAGVLEYNPAAKLVVCVRNPVQMAPSLHSERVAQGMDALTDFDQAWRDSESRPHSLYKAAASKDDPDRLNYKAYCRLGEQVERLLSVAPRERVHFIVFDDLVNDPQGVFFALLDFLDLPRIDITYEAVNQNKRIKSVPLQVLLARLVSIKRRLKLPSFGVAKALTAANKTVASRDPISVETLADMRRYFQDDVALLSRLLGRDLSHWLDAPAAQPRTTP
tara:strand:+ start:7015 stop:7917 length:903 start_codon:yes stop_codon:yes gene_type:complete